MRGGEPQRSCISCRKKAAKSGLLRYVLSPAGEVVLDYNSKLPGRGCYVCPDRSCMERVLRDKGFSRAFKKSVITTSLEEMQEVVSGKARGVMVSLISLAQRSGKLSSGAFAVEADLKSGGISLLLVMSDMSAASEQNWKSAAAAKGVPFRELPCLDKLQTILGSRKVIGVRDEGISGRLEIEIDRAAMSHSDS